MKQKPKVQKYCLMAPKGAYTDFHIDFGGSSVWYHVMKGEKVFYLIEPSESNLLLYDRWMQSSNRLQSFFADQVARCYRLVVKEGMTILLPSGWIHAVFTPEDTLVFGGNFLHNYSICTQLQIYEFEIKHKMEARFLFPQFKTLNWLAAGHLINVLTSINQTRSIAPVYLTKGLKSLWFSLKQWKTSPLVIIFYEV
ncbi:hypothetical protein AAG570_007928 [Ranatra chinensis]|uniref:JmjC domain-containing protein n=1 Tax=Ranatra chinensis TaxID=642074 RepID=A0ABD0XUN7_9HEMI